MSYRTFLKIAGLVTLGVGAICLALWLESHRRAVRGWGYVIAARMLCSLVTLTWALLLFRSLRHRQMAVNPPPPAMHSPLSDVPPHATPVSELTVYTLQSGCSYVVMKTFQDYYGNNFTAGERLTYQQRHFLPYEGGHTVVFAERTMYLQEEVNRAILDGFSNYLVAYTAA